MGVIAIFLIIIGLASLALPVAALFRILDRRRKRLSSQGLSKQKALELARWLVGAGWVDEIADDTAEDLAEAIVDYYVTRRTWGWE